MNAERHVSGARIRQARLSAGMTQATLARAAKVSERNIVRWENDKHTPRLEHIDAIARATGQDPSFFFETAEQPSSEDDEEDSSMANHREVMEALSYALDVALGKRQVRA